MRPIKHRRVSAVFTQKRLGGRQGLALENHDTSDRGKACPRNRIRWIPACVRRGASRIHGIRQSQRTREADSRLPGIRVQRIPAHRHGARHHRINPIHRMALSIWLYKSLRHRRYACAGALIAFYLFALASYPLRLPEFWIVLIILGVIATSEVSPIKGNFPKHPEGYKRLFLTAFALLGIACFLGQKAYYKAYQNWSRARMYYNNKAYESALPERIYPYYLLAPLRRTRFLPPGEIKRGLRFRPPEGSQDRKPSHPGNAGKGPEDMPRSRSNIIS